MPPQGPLEGTPRVSLIAPRSRRAFRAGAGIGLLLALVVGCAEERDPRLRERIISIDAQALERALSRAELLAGTPLARVARAAHQRIQECEEVWLHLPTPNEQANRSTGPSEVDVATAGFDDIETAIGCADEETLAGAGSLHAFVRSLRKEHDGVLLWPLGTDGHVTLPFDIDATGGIHSDGRLVPPVAAGALALLIPGDEAPDAPAIEPSASMIHLRMRPAAGLGLSRWIVPDSQAGRLFALQGSLLEGALLSGTWELAFMPPTPESRVPLGVIAVHHRAAGPVEAALAEMIDQLESTWPIERTPFQMTSAAGESGTGGCFHDLPLLPQFAPCWVVTPRALLVGYRSDALAAAMGPAAVSSGSTADPGDASLSGIDVDFAHLAQIDRVLGGQRAAEIGPGDVWKSLSIRLSPDEAGSVRVTARLVAQP